MQKYLMLCALCALARAASLPIRTLDIPVFVVYDDFEGAKIRRSPDLPEYQAVRNLDAKVQLSRDELAQAAQYFRVSDTNAIEDQPEQSQKPQESTYSSLGEASTTPEENQQNPNFVLLVQVAQAIVSSGLNNIRENLNGLGAGENKNPPISAEQWERLNATITNFFTSLLQRSLFKSGDRNVVAEIVTGFKGATDEFVDNLRAEAVTQKPQQPVAGQNIIGMVASGFQQISGALNSIPYRVTTQTTILGDAPSTVAPFGPFQNFVNGIQQFFGGLTTSKPPAPGELLSTLIPGNIQQGVQNLVNQVGQGIPGSQGQETNPIQQGVTSIINQVSNLVPSTVAPATQPPFNGPFQQVQTFFNNAGQAITNLFQGQNPGGTQQEGQTNPPGPFQQVIHNVQNAVSSVLNPSTAPPGAQHEGQSTQRPIQTVVQNVNQAISNLNPFNRPASGGAQNEGGTTAAPAPGPIQQAIQGFQNIASQIGNAITGGGTTKPPNAPGSSSQPGQVVVEQIGQAVSGLIPSGTSPAPGEIVSQIIDTASSLNPLGEITGIPGIGQQSTSPSTGSYASHS